MFSAGGMKQQVDYTHSPISVYTPARQLATSRDALTTQLEESRRQFARKQQFQFVKYDLCADEVEVEIYEPKPNKKILQILTVLLYMFSVSLPAILLSTYYVFLWQNPLLRDCPRQ